MELISNSTLTISQVVFYEPCTLDTWTVTMGETRHVRQRLTLTVWTTMEKRKSLYSMGLCLIRHITQMLDPS